MIDSDYPMVNIETAMENDHAINGKTLYFDWTIFSSYAINYQRVNTGISRHDLEMIGDLRNSYKYGYLSMANIHPFFGEPVWKYGTFSMI